ncbi:MAG: hypothetical protein AB9897_06265 [Anaerolineaceae bacterium]
MRSQLKTKVLYTLLIAAGIFLSLYLRTIFFPIITSDTNLFVIPWYDFIVNHGFWQSLSQNFYDYNPPYIYLIGLATLASWIPKLTAIKLISVCFDFVAAAAVYQIVFFKGQNKQWAWLAFFTVLLTPTVFIESGFWGQCDIIYTTFLLWMIYFLLREKYLQALLFFSIAFVFKSQAIFLAPLILVLLIKRKIPIYALGIPVLVYLVSVLPAWIAGRSFLDLISVYFSQTTVYTFLAFNAPSLYYPVGDSAHYSTTGVILGLVIALLFIGVYLFIRLIKRILDEPIIYLYDSCFLAFMMPFFLPKMHERYFFLAALLFIVILFFDKKSFRLTILVQTSTLLAFMNYMYRLPIDLTWIAFFINIVLVVWIFLWYLKKIQVPLNQTSTV